MDFEKPDIRPLPDPPRCRGVPIGDANFTGCAYGYGDIPPFTGPRDCPTCNGSGIEYSVIGTTVPHSDFGDPECCGCFYGSILDENQADIRCNECGLVYRTVPPAELQKVLDEMELSLDLASEICPRCGAINLFPGFSKMLAFVCRECGESVTVSE